MFGQEKGEGGISGSRERRLCCFCHYFLFFRTFCTEWKESGYSGTNSGTYVFNVTDMKLTTNTLEGEKLGEYTYSVVLKGNQLTLIEKDGDIRGPMTKK